MKKMIAAALAMSMAAAPLAAASSAINPAGPVVTGPQTPRHVLTVVSAFSCGFCRILDSQGSDELRATWIPRGLQIQSVPVVISPTDVATTIAATCGDPMAYLRRTTILFRSQTSILGDWNSSDQAQRKAAVDIPNGGGAERIARLAGLYEVAPSLGMTPAQLRTCLSDPARERYPSTMDRMAAARWKVRGTPTVLLDGRQIGNTWPEVRAALSQAFAAK